jgi:hypothetical protein
MTSDIHQIDLSKSNTMTSDIHQIDLNKSNTMTSDIHQIDLNKSNTMMPRYSWNVVKVGVKHQSINQPAIREITPNNIDRNVEETAVLYKS